MTAGRVPNLGGQFSASRCGGGLAWWWRGRHVQGEWLSGGVGVRWLSRSFGRKSSPALSAGGGDARGRRAPPWRHRRGVFFDMFILGASSSGESLDPTGRATSVILDVASLLWGVALKSLLPFALAGGLAARGFAAGSPAGEVVLPRVASGWATTMVAGDGLVAARPC